VQKQPVPRRLDQQMVMLARRAALGPPAPRHAEVKDHMIVAVGRNDAIFGAARQGGDCRPGQPLRQIGGKSAAQVRTKGGDRGQSLPLEKRSETADSGFDFG